MKKMDFEIKVGGIFGVVAIIAIISEMALAGFSSEAIAGGVKDIAGTMITVAVFIYAVKNIFPKKHKLTYEERLVQALDSWKLSHKPIISKTDTAEENKLRYYMLTDPLHFFDASAPEVQMASWKAGWFVKMPELKEKNYTEGKVTLQFHLNESTFFEPGTSAEQKKQGIEKLMGLFVTLLITRFSPIIDVTSNTSKAEITVYFKMPIETDEQIKQMIQVLDCMIQLYLIAAKTNL